MSKNTNKGIAVITGASSGIGEVYADRFAGRGYDLVLVARDEAKLNELSARLQGKHKVRVEVIKADLTVKTDLLRIEQRLREDANITLLLNNAGVAMSGELADADPDKLESMISLNVLAPSRLAAAIAPGFAQRGQGTLINISSVLALAPELFNGSYSGTKAYMLNFSLKLDKELGPKGVRVQAVLPGATRTNIWDRSGTGINNLPAEILMDTDEMVDAALVGLDRGETVTIPALPDVADWEAYTAARLKMGPNLSHDHAATRYQS